MKELRDLKVELLKIRLTLHEIDKLRYHSWKHQKSMSHIIREYIRRLPNPPHDS